MHNKAMMIDNRVAIVGGRNLAAEYFGLHGEANFRDLELIVGGPIVQAITQAFYDYWNNRWSMLVDKPPEDNPAEAGEAPVQVADAIVKIFNNASNEVLIVSAYLIPTSRLESIVDQAIDRGVRIRILTNSIASNNHLAAHSAYRNHVNTLLGHGAELHEVRTDAEDRHIYMLSPVETKALALHAKALVIDHEKVFIGSANLDPRSLRLSTEMGLLIESEALNAEVRAAIKPDFAITNACQLQFDDNGRVIWISDDQTLTVQPARSFMLRCGRKIKLV